MLSKFSGVISFIDLPTSRDGTLNVNVSKPSSTSTFGTKEFSSTCKMNLLINAESFEPSVIPEISNLILCISVFSKFDPSEDF